MELLVAIGIISSLMAITIPAFQGLRRKAYNIRSMNNLKELARGLNSYSLDHKDRYPPSVCTVGFSDDWQWEETRMIVAANQRSRGIHRSMSAYLYEYIDSAQILQCPGAPSKQESLKAVWDAGDTWDSPDTPAPTDPFSGTYCFYWNYTGLTSPDPEVEDPSIVFRGPWGPASGRKYSKILAGDFFNRGNGTNPPPNYASCEKFVGAGIKDDYILSSSYWTTLGSSNSAVKPSVQLKSVFIDEHIETNNSLDAVPLWVIKDRETMSPRSETSSTGIFYIPKTALPVKR